MATITQTVEEFLPFTKEITLRNAKMNLPPKTVDLPPKKMDSPQPLGCPPDCSCKQTTSYQPRQLFFTALGILVALIATYFIVTTDSNLYLVFWVVYSVLRRLMKARAHVKKD